MQALITSPTSLQCCVAHALLRGYILKAPSVLNGPLPVSAKELPNQCTPVLGAVSQALYPTEHPYCRMYPTML